MYNFLKKYNLTKLTPLVVKRLKRSISIKKKMDKLSKKLPPQKKVSGPGSFTGNSTKPSKTRYPMAP